MNIFLSRVGLVLIVLMLLIVSGCQSVEGNQADVKENDKELSSINEAENTSAQDRELGDIENRLKEAESRLTQLENLAEIQAELTNRNSIHLKQAHHLLNSIPALEVKKGYISSFASQETLQVQLINLLDEPDAPNGFVIEKTDFVPIKLSNHALIYNELGTYEVTLDEFITRKEDYRLYDIYLINNEIIMLAEMYIP